MKIRDIITDWIIMPQTIKPQGLIHKKGYGPNNRFGFKNVGNNKANEAVQYKAPNLDYEWKEFKENTGIDWNALRTAGVVQPMLYDVPTNPVRPTAQQPNIITAVNLKQKLGPGEKLTPLNDKAVTPEFWQKYMDDWWTKNKNDPRAKNKIDQIKQSARMKGVQFNENFADGRVKGKSRPGRVKKSGASCNGTVTSLRKKAKNASGEKAKMYHWCANMKSGRKKG